jgi:hypothetical protein
MFIPSPKSEASADDIGVGGSNSAASQTGVMPSLSTVSTASTSNSVADASAIAVGQAGSVHAKRSSSTQSSSRSALASSKVPVAHPSTQGATSAASSSGGNLSASAAALANQVKQQKHAVLLRLTLDWRSCDVSLFLLTRVFQYCVACVKVEHQYSENSSATLLSPSQDEIQLGGGSSASADTHAQPGAIGGSGGAGRSSIHEALLHDIIRGLMSVVKNSSRQPQYIDGYAAAYNIMTIFTAFLRDKSHSSDGPVIDRIFNTYGVCSPNHMLFHWTHNRPSVFKDMLLSVEEALRHGKAWTTEMKGDIIRAAWCLLTALMIKSEKNKESFKQLMLQKNRRGSASHSNYNDLVAIVTFAESPVSLETILCIFQTMIGVDGFHGHGLAEFVVNKQKPILNGLFVENAPLIVENTTVLPILMTLIPHCVIELQLCIFRSLLHLITGETAIVNLSRLTQMHPPLIELILDIFYQLPAQQVQKELLSLLKQLGQHSISVSQLKRIFRLMQFQNDSQCRQPHVGVLLDCLAGMIDISDGPKYFFHFQGQDSGLKLAPLNRWAATKGYSFSVWFCIENASGIVSRGPTSTLVATLSGLMNMANSNPVNMEDSFRASYFGPSSMHQPPPVHEPVLLSLRQSSGIGIEVLLVQNQPTGTVLSNRTTPPQPSYCIVVRSYTNKTVYSVTVELKSDVRHSKLGSMRQKQWHHLALAHTASTFRTNSEVCVMLDGDVVKERLSFPRFSEPIRSAMVGDRVAGMNEDPNLAQAGNATVNLVSAFCGEMGNIYLFSEALSEAAMGLIYSRGPSYSQLFKDVDVHISSTLMLTVNPGVNRGDNSYLDNTPETNAIRWLAASSATSYDFVSAVGLKGTFRCTTRDMRNTLDCLGGLKALLPLFAQVDMPSSDEEALSNKEAASEGAEENICLKILNLIFDLLRDSAENHKLMDGLGFGLVTYFLERISPHHLTMSLVECLVAHTMNLTWNVEWQDSVIKHILCNFKIWVNTDIDVQKYLFSVLLSLTRQFPQRMAQIINVQRLLDEMYLRFVSANSRKAPDSNGKSRTTTPVADAPNPQGPVTGGSFLSETDVYQLRSDICEIIFYEILGVDHNVCDDIQSIIGYVLRESFPPYKINGLQLLVRIISAQSGTNTHSSKALLRCMTSKRSMMGLLSLVSHSRGKVRLYTLLALCSLVQVVVSKFQLANMPGSPFASGSTSTAGVDTGSEKPKRSSKLGAMMTARLRGVDSSKVGGNGPSSAQGQTAGYHPSPHPTPVSTHDDYLSSPFRGQEPFEAIGISINALSSMFLWVQETLLTHLKSDFGGIDMVCKQTEIIYCALHLTMHGLPCKNLVGLIENLFPLPFGNSLGGNDRQSLSLSSPAGPDSSAAPKQPSYSFSADELKDWSVSSSDKICLPMMLVSILTFAQSEVVPLRKRLKFMLSIKTSLQSYDNYEAVLKVPGWQTVLFRSLVLETVRRDQLLASRASPKVGEAEVVSPMAVAAGSQKNRFNFSANSSNAQGTTEEIDALCEVILSILCDVHLHAVCFGVPLAANSTTPVVLPPGESSYDKAKMINAKIVLEEIANGTRVVGAIVLRETMVQLQSFVQDGSLQMDPTGLELMRRVITAIRRETESTSSESADTKSSRRRVLELNMWVIAAIILENFTLLPSTQFNSLYVRNRVSSPQLYELSSPDSNDSPNLTPTKTELSSNGGSLAAVSMPTSQSMDDFATAADTFNSAAMISTRSNSAVALRGSVGNRERGSSESVVSPTGMGSRSSSDIVAPAFATPSRQQLKSRLLAASAGRASPGINSSTSQSMPVIVWNMLESVFNMIGTTFDTFQPIWVFEKSAKVVKPGTIRIQQRAGYFSGDGPDERLLMAASPPKQVYSLNVVTSHGSVPVSISTSASHYSAANANTAGFTSGLRGIDSQFWVFIRATLNVFIHEAPQYGHNNDRVSRVAVDPRENNGSKSEQLITVCGGKLLWLIELAQQQARDFYDTEVIYVIGRLAQIFRNSCSELSHPWARWTLKYLVRLICRERVMLLRLLILGTEAYSDKLECSMAENCSSSAGSSTAGLKALVAELMEMTEVNKKMVMSTSDILASAEEYSRKRRQEMDQPSLAPADEPYSLIDDVLLRVIRQCLLPKFQPAGALGLSLLSWPIWELALESFLKQGRYEEEVLLSARLSEIGLHKRIDISELNIHTSFLTEWATEFRHRIDEAVTKTVHVEDRRLREFARNDEASQRKIAHSWNEILEKLANERGPWGTGTEDTNEVTAFQVVI